MVGDKVYILNENNEVNTLYLGSYAGSREGVITSPDKSLQGLPYGIGYLRYGFGQPYIFTPKDVMSQVALIPYTNSGGTGLSIGQWCLTLIKKNEVYVKQLGLSHYFCLGPEFNYVSFDLSPTFHVTNKGDLNLFFLYEENSKGKRIIKGDILLKIKVSRDDIEASLEPCKFWDALKIVDLLTKEKEIREWAQKCLSSIVPNEIKKIKEYKDEIPLEVIEELKNKIKKEYQGKIREEWK